MLILSNTDEVYKGNIIGVEKMNISSKLKKDVYLKFGGKKFNYEKGMSLDKFTLFNERITNGKQEDRWDGSEKTY